MATTYEAIATVTVGAGGASTIDFTSIPATYTDLSLKVSLRGTDSGPYSGFTLSFNGATTNRTYKLIYGSGSSVGNEQGSSMQNYGVTGAGATANTFGNTELYIPNYASSNYKSVSTDGVSETNASGSILNLGAYLWSSTSAINQITLTVNFGSFVQYSTATLYGIKNS